MRRTLPAPRRCSATIMHVAARASLLPSDRMGAVRRWEVVVVRGRSMLPTLRARALLLARGGAAAGRRARTGRLVVVRLPGGRPVSVKRLGVHDAGGWWV